MSRSKQWGMVTLVFGLVLICYWPALHGTFLWDDNAHVTRPDLRSWDGLRRIWTEMGATQQYYPGLHSAFWFEHRLWGDDVLGYHLVNLFCHATSACVLALLLRRLWSTNVTPPGATAARVVPAGAEWLAAVIFAVHPMAVESVAWISEQKNSLSLLFYLLAGLAYLGFSTHRKLSRYFLAFALFVVGLSTKSTTAVLPAVILVVLWWQNGRIDWRRDGLPLVPWFGVAVAAGLTTAWVEKTMIGAEGTRFDLSLMERALLAGRIVWFYFLKLLWPADLAFFYERWEVHSAKLGWIGYLAALLGVTLLLWRRRRQNRGLLAGWLVFVGALFPALGFFNVYPFLFSYVADHFQYLAGVGLIAVIVGAATAVVDRAPMGVMLAAKVVMVAGVGVLAFLSHQQAELYRNNETLFRATIEKNPASWMAHHILAVALSKNPAGRAEAVLQYRAAVRLNPDFPDAHLGLGAALAADPATKPEAVLEYERALELRPNYAEAHNALAVELTGMPGRQAEALVHYQRAIAIKPLFPEAHANYAGALAKTPDRGGEALAQYAEALRLRPDYVEAHYQYANLLSGLAGRSAEAVAHYEEALRLDPTSAVIHYNLANTLAHLPSRLSDSLPHYEAAIALKPDFADAQANLGNALSALGGHDEQALARYEAALKIDPSLATVHYNLALQLARIPARQSEAIVHAQEALRLKPDYLDAYNGLAILFAQQGRLEDAKNCWEKALQVNPAYNTARRNLELLERMQKR